MYIFPYPQDTNVIIDIKEKINCYKRPYRRYTIFICALTLVDLIILFENKNFQLYAINYVPTYIYLYII